MATTEHFFTGNNSQTSFPFTFPYLSNTAVKVELDNVLKTENTSGQTDNDYSISNTNIVFNSAPASGVSVHIYRNTNVDSPQAVYAPGSSIRAADLNNNQTQVLYSAQENSGQLIKQADLKDGIVNSAKIIDGSIVNADINASAAIAGTKIAPDFGSQNIATTGTVDGRDVSVDGTKLDTIETNAKDDQTASEIKTLYEGNSNTNAYTDAEKTKLTNIETAATADQTAAEIRTLVEDATDSNVFTDADHTKLNGIETGATADQTNAEIRAAVEAASDSNVFTDADHTKLNAIEANADVTDTTNVNAAGAVMNSDLATKGQILVGDGSGDPTALGVGTNNHVLVADSNEATGVKWATVPAGSGLSNIVEDTTPQLGGNLDVQASEINTSTTNGNIKLNPNGTGVVEIKGDGSSADGTLQLNCSQNSHGVKIKSPPHSAAASYTLTLPNNDGNAGQFLKTDGSGVLSFDTVTTPDSDKIEEGNTSVEVVDAQGNNSYGVIKADLGYTDSGGSSSTESNFIHSTKSGNDYTTQINQAHNGNNNNFTLGVGNTGGIGKFTVEKGPTNGDNAGILQYSASSGGGQWTLSTGGQTNYQTTQTTNIFPLLIQPDQDSTTDIGTTSVRWRNAYVDTYYGDGSNLTGIAAGATGGNSGANGVFWENEATVTHDYTISNNKNAGSFGPITINNGVTVTVGSGESWTIV